MSTVDNLHQALSLDVDVLTVLLKRHRCSHGRAIYFRRMSMALKSFQRHSVLESREALPQLEKQAIEYSQKRRRKEKRSSKHDDYWDIRGEFTEEQATLKKDWDALFQLYDTKFWEIISRIEHASSPLFLEISRGFFYPFCTVALGALSRIRMVLLRLGQHGLTKLHELCTNEQLKKFLHVINLEASIEKYLGANIASGSGAALQTISDNRRRAVLLKSLGCGMPKSTVSAAETSTTESGNVGAALTDSDGRPEVESPSSTASPSFEPETEGDDIGEPLAFERGETTIATTTQSTAPVDTMNIDRNMDIMPDFQSKSKKRQKMSNGEARRSSKKVKTLATSTKKADKKKKKKEKGKGDFFDALFD